MDSTIWICALKWKNLMKSHPSNLEVICNVDSLPLDVLISFIFWQKGSKKSLWRYTIILSKLDLKPDEIVEYIDHLFEERLFQLIDTADLDIPQFVLDPYLESLQR